MKKFFILILMGLSIQAFACLIPKGTEVEYYNKSYGLNLKTKIEISNFSVESFKGKQLYAPLSCGIQGCDYLLLIESSAGCFTEALSFSGKVIPLSPNNWNIIKIFEKSSAVDSKVPRKKVFIFQKTNFKYTFSPAPL